MNSGEKSGDPRALAREKLRKYHHQVLVGCGREQCPNIHCASSGKLRSMTRTEAAAHALKLFTNKNELCAMLTRNEVDSKELAKSSRDTVHAVQRQRQETIAQRDEPKSMEWTPTNSDQTVTKSNNKSAESSSSELGDIAVDQSPSSPDSHSYQRPLCERGIEQMFEFCRSTNDWAPMRRWLGLVFSGADLLNKSFVQEQTPPDSPFSVDLETARRSLSLLFDSEQQSFYLPVVTSNIVNLCSHVEYDLQYQNAYEENPHYLNLFLLIMELPILQDTEFLQNAFGQVCRMYVRLPLQAKAHLVRLWATQSKQWLLSRIQTVQQAITVHIFDVSSARRSVRLAEDYRVTSAVHLLHMFYCASILGGRSDAPSTFVDENSMDEGEDESPELTDAKSQESLLDDFSDSGPSVSAQTTDPELYNSALERQLGVSPWNLREPLVALDEMHNETLCEYLNVEDDYIAYKRSLTKSNQPSSFVFLPYFSFVVTPDVKMQFLFFENRIRMHGERRSAISASYNSGIPIDPYLRLRVRREHVVRDALVNLGTCATNWPEDLRKQLRVEFQGEQGIDEGGVSKEFYQLITGELFNPDYGMFVYNEETRLFWFNGGCTDCMSEYSLIGILMGLAIYNSIMLDVHFPLVLYRKLFGKIGRLPDLEQLDPVLYKSLQSLLDYDQDDIEDTFAMTFRISYTDVYGTEVTEDLKPDGQNLSVTKDNRQEFVDLYVDFILNRSVHKQFDAFRRGFKMVSDDVILTQLFVPQEIEQLVCGVEDFEFDALERTCKYSHGYDEEHPTIINFWQVVHSMSREEKKLLLQFTTGCDRIPIGGLAKMDFIIAKNGEDSDRLPTAHTCFNVLLLPEYLTKEKLKERLIKAITNSRGFGLH